MVAYPDVLIVEDTKSHLLIAQYTIQKLGIVARYAEDGLTAMEMVERYKPDLLLVDLWLPGANGEAVLEYTQNLYGKQGVHAIVTSSQTTDIDVLYEQYPIIRDYLVKPFMPQQLVDAICDALQMPYPVVE